METKTSYTAVVQRDGDWWIGWLEEIPGVNSQGRTREELLENLQSALHEALVEKSGEWAAKRSSRHTEISNDLARKICRDFGIPPP